MTEGGKRFFFVHFIHLLANKRNVVAIIFLLCSLYHEMDCFFQVRADVMCIFYVAQINATTLNALSLCVRNDNGETD